MQIANIKLRIGDAMNSLQYKLLLCGCLAIAFGVAQLRAGDEPSEKAKPASALDQQLLEGLDNALLEGLDDAPTKAATSDQTKAAKKLNTPSSKSPVDDDLLRELARHRIVV